VSGMLADPPNDPHDPDDDRDDPDGASRRHALWGLLVLALAAVVVVSSMMLLSGNSSSNHRGLIGITDTAQPPTSPASSAPPSSPSPSRTATTTSARPKPTRTGNPCPSAAPCAVPGDDGGAVAAVNAFRVSHGGKSVPGAVSAQAQQCALQQGNGATCVPHYAWQPTPAQDGVRAVAGIAGRGDGAQWLLDPAVSSFSVGWAYAPGTGYELAVLKIN
jgi:MYXO-CTERM domain-containing protein